MDTSGYMSSMQRNKAFTLIELLIVLGLIMVASSVMVISSGNNDGVALKSSQRIVSSIAQGARGQAILKQTPTRILIYADRGANRDEDKYLRFSESLPKIPKIQINGSPRPKVIIFPKEFSSCLSSPL